MFWLACWTAVGAVWWTIACWLVWRAGVSARGEHDARPADTRRISIFKPIPSPLGESEFRTVHACLSSFVADMDDACELLIGARPPERTRLEAFVTDMREAYPGVQIRLLVGVDRGSRMHPKVAWNRELARLARGQLWLWSDADIRISAGTLRSLRADIAGHAGMVTSPYVVGDASCAADMLDALFVNLEFYPGVELLRRTGGVQGGFGSGMLFAADEFAEKVCWEDLGSHLAEDYALGRKLAPVRLASTRLLTEPASQSWLDALLHYLRWQKTVRWCQPGGFAAQLAVLPVIGWLACLLAGPLQPVAWFGLAAVLVMDALAAVTVSLLLGFRLKRTQLAAIPVWSVLRGVTWVACWFPWPVVWRGRRWWSARLYDPARGAASGEAVGK